MDRREHVVIGTVNHAVAFEAIAKQASITMALRQTIQVHQGGSRKDKDSGEWFAEPPNNELDRLHHRTKRSNAAS